jgi:hypothetical protein
VTAAEGPRIPWRRVAALQLGAGAFVAFAAVLFLFEFGLQAVPLGMFAVLVVTAAGALPPFLGALAAHRIATRRGRDRRREVVAVVIGALAGSLVPLVVFSVWLGLGSPDALAFTGIVAAASAIGFAIWVLVAWRRKPAATETPADSLN